MANNNDKKIDQYFRAFQNRISNATSQLPLIVGNLVVNDALDNFRTQSFDGVPWPKRKTKSRRGAGNQNILIQSGRLRRETRITSTTPTSVKVGNSAPYAAVHNDGGEIRRSARSELFVRNRYKKGAKGKMFGGMGAFKKGTTSGKGLTFKAYSFKMPRRRFLGRSAALDRKINKTVKNHILRELRK
ncbi:hypothetical protein DBR40_09120 [Pedobacter sp. KBW01]|uniref:phage virion morphogenesis protein n=1 Tax=Pedobacter sp. KBW01 TaxID=2153364 RepID=UPI000F592373|nr:phage virion morphogenesis protein [Pedobacter sp. KBW01]RQO78100.1 hypothetical protein DBR40_09120 [Pedobacter sp. KBW01]